MNIVEQIERRMAPESPALWVEGETTSFGDLFRQVNRVAERLRRWPAWNRAAVPRIGLLGDNGADYVVAALAVLKAGGCFVPVAGELAPPERTEVARTTALHGVLALGRHDWPGGCDPLDEPLGLRGRALDPAPPRFPEDAFEALAPAFIRFSSGTTGQSKGVVLSHHSLLARIESANRALRIGPGDRILWTLPMAHHFAVSIVLYLHFGALTVIETARMAADVLETAERSRATVIYGSPFHHAMLAADPGAFRWPTLRLAVSTAAPLRNETARAFLARFDRPLVQGLGIIECGMPVINIDAPEDAPESIGLPVDGWQTKLRGPAETEPPAGTPGELLLRGPGMFDAYLHPWSPRSEIARDDGFFATGDLCARDAAGRLSILGRTKSVINVGGMKVFPEEVEAVLDACPGVARSRVSARPHPVFGAVPTAEVIPADPQSPPAPAALRSACQNALAAHKTPASIRIAEHLPTTPSGKLRRGE